MSINLKLSDVKWANRKNQANKHLSLPKAYINIKDYTSLSIFPQNPSSSGSPTRSRNYSKLTTKIINNVPLGETFPFSQSVSPVYFFWNSEEEEEESFTFYLTQHNKDRNGIHIQACLGLSSIFTFSTLCIGYTSCLWGDFFH